MAHYSAIDTKGISWYIGPCLNQNDAELRAQSMGIKATNVVPLVEEDDADFDDDGYDDSGDDDRGW